MTSLMLAGGLSAILYSLLFLGHAPSGSAWIVLVPLISRLGFEKPKTAFWTGWLSGWVAYTGIGHWLLPMLLRAHLASVGTCFGVFLIFVYLGFLWGLWFLGVSQITRWAKQHPILLGAAPLVMAMGWVALEYLRTYLFSGLPWALLADTQIDHPLLLQLASVTGVYGISFLIVWANGTLALGIWFICAFFKHESLGSFKPLAVEFIFLFLTLGGTLWFGQHRLQHPTQNPAQSVSIAIVQPNSDPTEKWSEERSRRLEAILAEMDSQAALPKPDIILWPEGAVPEYPFTGHEVDAWLRRVIETSRTPHLIGGPRWDGKRGYNTAFSITGDFRLVGTYDKVHLCPFAEVTPFVHFLGRWFHKLNELRDCKAGSTIKPLFLGGILYSPMICYESIFPSLIRRSVQQGGQVIVSLSNDGWFGETPALSQHFAASVWRAVENDRWLICVDNSGISAIINSSGIVVARTPMFQRAILRGIVYPRTSQTFYGHYGDVFAKICSALSVLIIFWAIFLGLYGFKNP